MHNLKFIELDIEKYKGTKIVFNYQTDKYYDVIYEDNAEGWSLKYQLKDFETVQNKSFDSFLFEDYIENPSGYGLEIDGKIIGWLIIGIEEWSQRLRVWDILLEPEYRRFGYGKLLMDKAKELAKEKKLRLVILETQTCNYKAIEFYKAQGFKFIGTDLTCYSNNDVENKDVRLELGYFLK